MMIFFKKCFFIAIMFGISFAFSIGTSTAVEPITMQFTTGTVGGGWYTMTAGISELIKQHYPEITIKSVPGGGTLNQARVGTGKTLLGVGLGPFMAAAAKGVEPYDRTYPDLMAIGGSLSKTNLHWVAAKDTGVRTIKELIEKKYPMKITVNPVGTTDEFSLRKILEFYGYTYKDIKKWGGKVFFAGYSDAVSLLKDRHVDFGFANIGPPAAYLMDAKMGRPLNLITFPKEIMDHLVKEYGYTPEYIPKSVYPDMLDEDYPTPGMGSMVICHRSVPEEVVYAITKTLCENKPRLVEIHASMKVFDPPNAWRNMPVPLHPGAVSYYKEMGYMK
ncbi:MAG: TAXI family TRAP transporter solute-binding subunit [Pseudomonadota bacterium]